VYNDGMSDEREERLRASFGRIAWAAFGAAIVLLGALWIALPFLILGGMGPGNKWEDFQPFLTPWPYLGLLPIGVGLLLIYRSR
jgi:hypothetical protein